MKRFKELTYRQKNIYAGVGFLVVCLIIYKMNVSKTLALYSENVRLSEQIERAENAPQQLTELRDKQTRLNASLANYIDDAVTDQKYLLAITTEYCDKHGLRVRNFPETKIEATDNFQFQTNEVVVEGKFTELLKLMYLLETKYNVGRLASAEFEKIRDKKIRREVLLLKIHFQKIKEIDATTI